MLREFVLLLWVLAADGASHCGFSNSAGCSECVQHEILWVKCRWCPMDNQCHDDLSPHNPCNHTERISARSQCPDFAEDPPQQLHIALAGKDAHGNPNGMTVSWSTIGPYDPSVLLPTVFFGTAPGNYTRRATGYSRRYGPEDWNSHHHVLLSPLLPGVTYYYIVGGANSSASAASAAASAAAPASGSHVKPGRRELFSSEHSFRAAPARTPDGGEGAPFSVGFYGDFGFSSAGNADTTRRNLENIKTETDFFLHAGDIAYADDSFLHTPATFGYESIYNQWMNWMANISASQPYMVSVGNHESECHSPSCVVNKEERDGLRNFTAYNARWHMPSEESGGVENMWYSFNYGAAHFVVLNTETDFPGAHEENKGDSNLMPAGHFAPDGAYMEWLQADLAAANEPAARKLRPWVIMTGHRPTLSCADHSKVDAPGLNADVEFDGPYELLTPLMARYKVDVLLAGHEHAYSRFLPRDASRNLTAVVIAGGAGCDEMKLGTGKMGDASFSEVVRAAAAATRQPGIDPTQQPVSSGGGDLTWAMAVEGMIIDVNVTVAEGQVAFNTTEQQLWWEKFKSWWGPFANNELQEPKWPPSPSNLTHHAPPNSAPPKGVYEVFSQGDAPEIFSTGVLTVFNSTTLRWQMRSSSDNSVLDEFFLTK